MRVCVCIQEEREGESIKEGERLRQIKTEITVRQQVITAMQREAR